ncbi:conserved hypothetical protein [Histoplasma capsulatum G186AR]|uniref:Uncharacterized protein n=2 Tax=Ajellomyces capsulatus TaxID=5037 RepID=C0NWX7_AJECG|nr:uncharacterized protein HCBG_07969 [Histoplasma capsulatum G186AR]EEH03843.1 conserved hypothetical protein [Histoplasma capsulatum G186AR]KAG5295448.1 hypothetical protein I7I52_05723 [Histoplasma capsulatum]QSS73429.1 hypothetical protein I7I50_08206 [Histoplasma capsulatum G186AR]
MRPFIITFLVGFIGLVSASTVSARQYCGPEYEMCVARGSSSVSPPSIGPDMRKLFVSVIESVDVTNPWKRGTTRRDDVVPRAELPGLCCKTGMECRLLINYHTSFCWDRFTTNFYLIDGSYGSILTGIYNNSGDIVDLISGKYTRSNGETGNIYAGDEASKPNTSTMVLPPAWTSKGVGTAIPGSELGGGATYTTTIPDTTKGPGTIPLSTPPATNTLTTTGPGPNATRSPSTATGEKIPTIPAIKRTFWPILMFMAFVGL